MRVVRVVAVFVVNGTSQYQYASTTLPTSTTYLCLHNYLVFFRTCKSLQAEVSELRDATTDLRQKLALSDQHILQLVGRTGELNANIADLHRVGVSDLLTPTIHLPPATCPATCYLSCRPHVPFLPGAHWDSVCAGQEG